VGRVLIQRIGFTPLKGGRHMTHDLADLTPDGPAGDRVFWFSTTIKMWSVSSVRGSNWTA